ncbi:MAG: Maf family protein, partial [Rectinemataceae bacterium]|nr:Maf family protein [Spirochaetaceae bacterium]
MFDEPIILASESPRRSALLESLGIPFYRLKPDIDESIFDHLEPEARVMALAEQKARKGALLWREQSHEALPVRGSTMDLIGAPRLVLGADTLVAFPPENPADAWHTIGKPENRDEAASMLHLEQGRTQKVFSGICLFDLADQRIYRTCSISEVAFAPMTDAEIEWYLDLEEWRGVAGAYRVQGAGSFFIQELRGSWSGVMGLPIHEFYGILLRSGYLARNAEKVSSDLPV